MIKKYFSHNYYPIGQVCDFAVQVDIPVPSLCDAAVQTDAVTVRPPSCEKNMQFPADASQHTYLDHTYLSNSTDDTGDQNCAPKCNVIMDTINCGTEPSVDLNVTMELFDESSLDSVVASLSITEFRQIKV